MFDPISTAISGVSNVIGGLMGQSEKEKDREYQRQRDAQNIALQKEFAQSGIQWKVEDARKAGVHPLAALGAGTSSFSNVVGNPGGGAPLAEGVRGMGQDISRAVAAASTQETRMQMIGNSLLLERGKLENDLLKTQIASGVQRLKQQVGPPMPGPNLSNITYGPDGASVQVKDYDKYTPMIIGGDRFRHDPRYSDAKQGEDRWGEFGGDMYGLYVMAMDFLNHYVGSPSEVAADMAERRRGMREGRPLGRR